MKKEEKLKRLEDMPMELPIGLSEADVVEGIFQYGLQEQRDYRKYALAIWLLNHFDQGIIHNYSDAMEFASNNLEFRQVRLAYLKSESHPDFLIDRLQKLVNSASFVKNALIEEKAFAEKFLAR